MIDVSPYIDKLEALPDFIYWKTITPGNINSVKMITDLDVSQKWALIARVTTMTFSEWYDIKTQLKNTKQ